MRRPPPACFTGRRADRRIGHSRLHRPGFRQSTCSPYRPRAAITVATMNGIQPTRRKRGTGSPAGRRSTHGDPRHGRARDRISRGGRKAVRDPSSRSLSRLSPRPSSYRGVVRRSARMSWQMDSRPSRVPAQRDARRSRIPGFVCRSQSLHHLSIGKRVVPRTAGFVSFHVERPVGREDIENVAPVTQKAGHVAGRTDGVDGR